MSRFFIACAIIIVLSFGGAITYTRAQATGEPELPRVFLSTTYPTTGGTILNVTDGGNLQAALASAQPGDTVVLQAGAVYTGNFILPNKTGDQWITIRTSNLAGISAEGTRVSPNQAGAMPRIVSANAAPALATAVGAHHYRLIGLEIGLAATASINYGIVALGDSSQNSLSMVPHDLAIDRCYIHGNSTGDVSRGVALNSASTSIIDSHISGCHGVGFDTQAIAGWNGPGPFKIVNNYLEAAGENVMFGGADPRVPNLIPSDIEFRRNYLTKPLSWNPADPTYAGIHWSVKNLFELKNAQRVLVDGNIFEHSWVDGQTGFLIVFTPRNQDGTAPWSGVNDVTFSNNIARHAASGIQFLGHDDIHPSQQAQRIKIKNNLFYDLGASRWGGNGRLFQIVDGTADVHIDHNTALQTSNIVTADGTAHTGFVYTNNIAPHNDYGFMGSGRSFGNDSIGYYFPGCYLSKNVLIGGPGNLYPTGNFFPASINDVSFVDPTNENYRLMNSSPYKNAGTDGRDIGADQDEIIASIGGEEPPPSASTNQPPQVSVTGSPMSGPAPLLVEFTVNAFDPDGTIASYNWDFGDGQTSALPSVSHLYQTAGTFNAHITVTDNLGLSAIASIVISATSAAMPPGGEVVLYASKAPVQTLKWKQMTDGTAAGGKCIWNADSGANKITNPFANPPDYFEMTFHAVAGTAYRLWLRGKAQNDSPYNDSVFVQFSGSVNSVGAPVFRIGSSDATTVNLEDCAGCGVQGWGWQDNGWGVGELGPLLYFRTTGTQTLRVQVREDGLMIDQIVLSPRLYINTSPGALKNDTTIRPESVGLSVTSISAAIPSSGATAGGTSLLIKGSGFTPGATVTVGGMPAASVQVESATSLTAVAPSHSAGIVDILVVNPDGGRGALLSGYTYIAPNQPPQVSITASKTSGISPVTVDFTANASDPDGTIAEYKWDFGDGQISLQRSVTHLYLAPGTYSAKVTVTDNLGVSSIASIPIIVVAPSWSVNVLYPNGGETFVFNSTCIVTWAVTGGSPQRQEVDVSLDGGLSWTVLASGLPAKAKSFSWLVPKIATTSARIRVRVWDVNGTASEDISDRNFAVQKRRTQ